MNLNSTSYTNLMDSKDKSLIRKEVLVCRDSINNKLKMVKDERIKETLLKLPEFRSAHKVLLYASFRSEVDTSDLLKYCLARGKITVLPRVERQKGELRLYEIRDIGEIALGYLGIPEPVVNEDRRINIEEVDLAIVPGVAFDEKCDRLGYGMGFYDKLLSGIRDWGLEATERNTKPYLIALSYAEQIVEMIPSRQHDIKMDRIITDKRIITCRDKQKNGD